MSEGHGLPRMFSLDYCSCLFLMTGLYSYLALYTRDAAFPHALVGFFFMIDLYYYLTSMLQGHYIPACSHWLLPCLSTGFSFMTSLYCYLTLLLQGHDIPACSRWNVALSSPAVQLCSMMDLQHYVEETASFIRHDRLLLILRVDARGTQHSRMLWLD